MTAKKKAANRHLSAISLFAGGGGLDLGFSAAGFHIGCSTDIDPFSKQTLLRNSGKKHFYNHAHSITADLRDLTSAELMKSSGLTKGQVDIVIGGPPCQAFSVFGRRKGLADPRGNLVWEYERIIREVQPRAFVFENVAGLKSIHGGSLFSRILEELTIDGMYTISAHCYQVVMENMFRL
jgi:DNA (cytosine-5)-methyltransferase 1